MTAQKAGQGQQSEKQGATGASPSPTGKEPRPALKAPPPGAWPADTSQPGGGQGRVDVTGIMPEGIRVDPNITEGHPGYEESGESEIIPAERFTRKETGEEKNSG